MHNFIILTFCLLAVESTFVIYPHATANLNAICPDGREQCDEGNTCCLLQTGDFGCCPYKNAVCCSDKVHCCPNHYQCDVEGQTCTRRGYSELFPWFVPVATSIVKEVGKEQEDASPLEPFEGILASHDTQDEVLDDIADPGGKCLDGKPCPEQFTCCSKLKPKEYGCCPYKDAVCCTDKIHCCPKGSVCNTTEGSCNPVEIAFTPVRAYSLETRKLSVIPLQAEKKENVCGNGKECKDKQNCCGSGCCPLEEAGDCCENFDYCCPKGTVCSPFEKCRSVSDPSISLRGTPVEQTVDDITSGLQWFYSAMKKLKTPVFCPDKSWCPPGNTCCFKNNNNKSYGCCPYTHATCCPDKASCCPSGYDCYGSTSCTPKSKHLPVLSRTKTTRSNYYF